MLSLKKKKIKYIFVKIQQILTNKAKNRKLRNTIITECTLNSQAKDKEV